MIEAKRIYSKFNSPEARRAARKLQQQIQNAVKEEKQSNAKEMLAEFVEKTGTEQLAENNKLYHRIKNVHSYTPKI